MLRVPMSCRIRRRRKAAGTSCSATPTPSRSRWAWARAGSSWSWLRKPGINYIGIERYSSVLLRGLQKRAELELDNIFFMCIDAKTLADVFAPGEVNRIYLNFSDPWPKDRHAKRRLTSPEFMAVYDSVLAPEGMVEFKTDNRGLFDYSLESIPAAGWTVKAHTFDLHHSDMAEGNVMTEYEIKFSAKGQPICKLVACRTPQP